MKKKKKKKANGSLIVLHHQLSILTYPTFAFDFAAASRENK